MTADRPPAGVPARTSPAATDAYVRIYEEEQPRLVAYARSLTRNSWAAEDVVAEAHFRVWRRLSAGHEIDNVPAYLMTTVRHLASSLASSASSTHETPRDPQVPEQASAGHVADPAEQVSATDLLVRVLGELPERWVRALWLADAEGQSLETVGHQIGAKQGATAVLLHRAREGMRQAFLRSQTEAPEDPACEVHWVRMPAYVRGNATPRQSERLLAHVDACDGCRERLAVLIRANDRLPALVGPALLVFAVGGGTGKFLASLTAGSAGSASATVQGLLRTARAARPRTKAALASGTAVAAVVAVVLALGVHRAPTTVTSPERVPVAQAPVAGPSAGSVGEVPGGALPVAAEDKGDDEGEAGVDRGRDRGRQGGGAGSVVTGEAGESGVPGRTGDSRGGSDGTDEGGVDGGGVVGEPSAPGQPAPEVPDPGPGPVQPEPVTPDPGPGPADPAPGDEEPGPPVNPTPTPPEEQKPEPEPKPEPKPEKPEPKPEKPEPKPEKPKPGAPGDGTPVPEPPSAPAPRTTHDGCGPGPEPDREPDPGKPV
ncbi:sigma-70 family RNA polymerase sigma factor [Streptomyces sp. WSLK1-5]|uniref:sigma-70 family RNA polymerase sigma factor n=1 Tax=unclassified Streptomyces TaxID=2593676 RepID=UPI0037A2F9FD